MSKPSPRFRELWSNEKRSLDISGYEQCLNERQSAHNKHMLTNYVITITFFCAGLWALSENAMLITVILLALAVQFVLISFHHSMVSESMNTQRLLAMLINKQSQDLESLRSDVRGS